MEAFYSVILDKEVWSAVDRVKAYNELDSLFKSNTLRKKQKVKVIKAFQAILGDPEAFSLLKFYYERKGPSTSYSQQETIVEDSETVV